MIYKEVAKRYGFPVKFIVELHKLAIIHDPVTDLEDAGLSMLRSLWGKDFFIKLQLARKPTRDRIRLALTSSLTKVEGYILMRYIGNLRTGERLYVMQVADEVHYYYGVPRDRLLFKTIRKIRDRAYKIYINDAKIKEIFSKETNKKKPRHDATKVDTQRNAFKNIFGY